MRASGHLGKHDASITVVRDEAGNVQFEDNTTVAEQQASWLARKAGVTHHISPADEHRGAKQLIEKELMAGTIEQLKGVVVDAKK